MKQFFFILLFIGCNMAAYNTFAQNKSGDIVIFGSRGIVAKFTGDTSKPSVSQLWLTQAQTYYTSGHSNICDSATGKILMASSGYTLYDSLGNIMDNGDTLVPVKIYAHNSVPSSDVTQGSIILPKGSNGLYYIFTPTITDSMYDYWLTNPLGDGRGPYNLLQYHVIDINANGGLGKVIKKNIPLLQNVDLHKVGMMACRHANGYDWWLLKQASYDSNVIYTILVTADTVQIKDTLILPNPVFKSRDFGGQACFNKAGNKYAYSMGRNSKLFLADFDRCTGKLSNYQILNIPIDSTTDPFDWQQGRMDSLITGLCFSANDSFLYINRSFNIYQYELHNTDSATAWYRVKHGTDTTLLQFNYYGQMYRGPDDRIYIGKYLGSSNNSNSTIDKPNNKGSACDFCTKCFRYNVPNTYTTAPANIPDFNLGALTPCWPDSVEELNAVSKIKLHPNPVQHMLYIDADKSLLNASVTITNVYGQVTHSFMAKENNVVDVSNYPKGVYFISAQQKVRKVLVE